MALSTHRVHKAASSEVFSPTYMTSVELFLKVGALLNYISDGVEPQLQFPAINFTFTF